MDGAGRTALGPVERQTVSDRLGVCDEVGVAEGVRVGQRESGAEPVGEMVSMGADGGRSVDQRVAGTDEQSRGDGGAALGRDPRLLERRIDDCVPGRTQQFVFGNQTQGPRLPFHRVSDCHALLCRWQAGDSLLWLIPTTNVEEAEETTWVLSCALYLVRQDHETERLK